MIDSYLTIPKLKGFTFVCSSSGAVLLFSRFFFFLQGHSNVSKSELAPELSEPFSAPRSRRPPDGLPPKLEWNKREHRYYQLSISGLISGQSYRHLQFTTLELYWLINCQAYNSRVVPYNDWTIKSLSTKHFIFWWKSIIKWKNVKCCNSKRLISEC